MKATFEKEALLLAITRSLGCVAEKMTSVIEGIYVNTVGQDRCQICAYDIEKGIKIEISAKVEESGSFVINGAKLASIVKFMPSEVTLETGENNIITVSSGRSKFQLHYLPGSDFPKIPEFSPERHFSLPQKLLRKIINQTAFAISGDETRPALTGLYIEINPDKIKAVACDSFRLAVREVNAKTDILKVVIGRAGYGKLQFELAVGNENCHPIQYGKLWRVQTKDIETFNVKVVCV